MRTFYVYIMTNRSGTLYVGMTNNLERRVQEHRTGTTQGFTKRYSIDRLVYYEDYPDAPSAIAREKQIKGRVRRKKIDLIRGSNSLWRDLAETWFEKGLSSGQRA